MKRETCLISDIDGTIKNKEKDLSFAQYAKKNQGTLFTAYATGRSYEAFLYAVEEEALYAPDAAILYTGADIYIKEGIGYEHLAEWHEKIRKSGWDFPKVVNLFEKVMGIMPQENMYEYRPAYYINPGMHALVREQVKALLESEGLKAQVIISGEKYLDVLPLICDKGKAAVYLVAQLGIDREKVIVAGDSGNDVHLFEKFKRGIVVANADADLKNALTAMRGKDIYFAKQGYALGVIEGLDYFDAKGEKK